MLAVPINFVLKNKENIISKVIVIGTHALEILMVF